MQIIEQIREKLKEKDVSVLKLSKEIGISPYKIYKWLDGKSQPKYEDRVLMEKWLSGSLENVPHGTSQISGTSNGTSKAEGTISVAESKDKLIFALEREIDRLTKQNDISLRGLEETLRGIKETLDALPGKVAEGLKLGNSFGIVYKGGHKKDKNADKDR